MGGCLLFLISIPLLFSGCIEDNVVCDEPYVRFDKGCCLDVNDNRICDTDEPTATATTTILKISTSTTTTTIWDMGTTTSPGVTTTSTTTFMSTTTLKIKIEPAVVIVMDVSESMNTYMRDTDKSRLTTAKNFVMNLFSQLDSEDKIGVVILTSSPFSITFNLVPLENNTDFFRAALMPVIAQDGAYMPDALNEAENLFRGNDFKGEKHIVLLFDGVSSKNQFNKTREKVTEMADGGVTIHAVNVGFDSIKDEDFIKEIVKLGNGHYFEPDQYTDLKAEIDKT